MARGRGGTSKVRCTVESKGRVLAESDRKTLAETYTNLLQSAVLPMRFNCPGAEWTAPSTGTSVRMSLWVET